MQMHRDVLDDAPAWPTREGEVAVHDYSWARVIELLGGQKQLRLTSPDALGLQERIRAGFPPTTVDSLSLSTGLTAVTLAGVLGLSVSTITRKKQNHRPLDPAHSDRAFRVARAFSFAEEVFGDQQKAQRWMHKPNRAMGGAVPVELLDTELGEDRVRQILKRIEWGVYS